jgi:hypothetical protein
VKRGILAIATLLVVATVPLLLSAAALQGLEEAIAAQRVLLEESPRDADLLNDLGNLLALAGSTKEAEEVYLEALDVDPDRVATRFNLGLLYQEAGRKRHARRAFEAVVKADPDHAWAHYQLGRVLDDSGNRRIAVKHYARALRLEPRLSLADYNPHIVDNELAVQGVLTAYSDDSSATLTPREYQHPDQLRALLVPAPPVPAEPSVETSESPEEDAVTIDFQEIRELGPVRSTPPPERIIPPHRKGKGARGYVPEWAREPEAESAAAPESTPTPGATVMPEATAMPEPTSPTPPGTPSGPAQPGPRQPSRTPASGGTADPQAPAEPETPQSPDPGYEPDIFSTGRLEIRLVPASSTGVGEERHVG